MSEDLAGLFYLVASICFILALRGLSHPTTSRTGNIYGMVGMAIAIFTTVALPGVVNYGLILAGIVLGGGIGTVIALRINMTALPQLVAAFHSLVGLAAVLVALAAFYKPEAYGIGMAGDIKVASLIEMSIGIAIGAITFTGSIVAFAKLQGLVSGKPLVFPMQHPLNAAQGIAIVALIVWLCADQSEVALWLIVLVSLAVGFLLIVPIGGADMPVVVSMLNSYSGWAACGIGFTLGNNLLIVTGALVGSSGAILSYIMCKGMNRSIINVILGGFGTDDAGAAAAAAAGDDDRQVKAGSPDDAAFLMKNGKSVIIVPGYGMAVAQAQHVLREMSDLLKADGVDVRYAIPLRRGLRDGGGQPGLQVDRRRLRHRRQRHHQPGGQDRSCLADLRHADPRCGGRGHRLFRQALNGHGLCRRAERAVLQGQHLDALRRRQGHVREDREGPGNVVGSGLRNRDHTSPSGSADHY
jgi:NAD(P) transhydrogenase subunit beta